MATDTKRYKLENGNKGSEPHVTEAIHADLLEVFETGSLLIQSLGYPIFDSLIPKTAATSTESEVWHLKGPDTQATGTFSSSGFVIHSGSLCRKDLTKSAKDSFVSKKRAILLKDEILTETETHYVFAEDYEFNSPSGAAVVALGRHANGWKEWKNPQGHSLDQVKRKNL